MKYISTIFSLLPALRGSTINLNYESFKELFYLRMKTHVVEIHKVKEPFFTQKWVCSSSVPDIIMSQIVSSALRLSENKKDTSKNDFDS